MIKVGLIGEDPNDTSSIKNLLLQKFEGKLSFIQLQKNIRGHQLDNVRVKNALEIEYKSKKPDWVVFIRDTDCIVTEKNKIKVKENWFKNLLPAVNNYGLLLLNIYELEAMILADITTFNRLYGTSIQYKKDVMYQKEPKEFLKTKTKNAKKKYEESHCPDVFAQIQFETVIANCKYLKEFVTHFKTKLKIK
jgi:hypothetical protein